MSSTVEEHATTLVEQKNNDLDLLSNKPKTMINYPNPLQQKSSLTTQEDRIVNGTEQDILTLTKSSIEEEENFEVLLPLHTQVYDKAPCSKFKVLQSWEGVITEIEEDSVWADIHDLTPKSTEEEIVQLSIEEFSKSDRSLLVNGSVFYWTIGYETAPGGQIKRFSQIRMKRTPKWSRSAIESVQKKAQKLFQWLNPND